MLAILLAACLIPFAVISAHDDEPCCYPDQLSGETMFHGRKMNDFYIDYNRGEIVENWNGKLGTSHVLYDLKMMKRYRLKTDGTCKVYDIDNAGNFAKCMPEDASKVEEDEHTVSYSYQLPGETSVKKTLSKESCLPISIIKTRGTRAVTMSYHAQAGIDDEDVFQLDLSHCSLE